jgi:CBS domain-containing protein
MKVREIMTPNAEGIQSRDTVRAAAERMRDLNIGVLPVLEGERVSGIVTDRDIVVRCIASQLNPSHTSVGEIMSKQVQSCQEEADIEEAAEIMENFQLRRLLVRDDSGLVTGIVSLGDIAVRTSRELAGEAIHDISEPGRPER